MMKMNEVKKMIKERFDETCLWNLSGEVIVERQTYGVATVELQISYVRWCLGTFSLLDENCQLDPKKFKEVDKYVKRVLKSLVGTEEMYIKLVDNINEYEL